MVHQASAEGEHGTKDAVVQLLQPVFRNHSVLRACINEACSRGSD
jgi:hypothetical protein